MSIGIASHTPSPLSVVGPSPRPMAGDIARTSDQQSKDGATATNDRGVAFNQRIRGAGHDLLDASTLTALTDTASSDSSSSAPTPPADSHASPAPTTGTTSESGKRVAIDFIHVELPNGAKFDLSHTPSDGESSDDALKSLLSAAEELSKLLSGLGAAATHQDGNAPSGDAAASAYAKQLSAYAESLAQAGTVVSA
ncbi:hypothetical protein WHZ77_27845 [Bradyrhizobium sp. A5]|uniref:hypothetical protein n=1 Tax=Bradyrhizobium sp. A5 TaxID=3133696 RepID=UPI00324FBB8B